LSAIVLDLLAELQLVADKINLLEARRKETASEKDRIEAKLASAREDLERKQQQHRAMDLERRKRELQLREEKERHQRIKGRVGDVKTSREYQAVLSETSSVKQSINTTEEAILQDMEALQNVAKEIEEATARIQRIEADAAEAVKTYEMAVAETEKELADHRAVEKDILAKLPRDIVSRYKMILSRRNGWAVAEVRKEACQACFMRIPPQTYIEIARKSRLMQCPNCHRILIPPRDGVIESPEPNDDD
jgi:predicted  nucleic acid-binding Zn-ribbon protein